MGYSTDGLIVAQARHEAAIHNFEDASFGFDCSIGSLVEKTPHLSVALRATMTGRLPRTFLVSRTDSYPRARFLSEANTAAVAPTSARICWAESTPRPG